MQRVCRLLTCNVSVTQAYQQKISAKKGPAAGSAMDAGIQEKEAQRQGEPTFPIKMITWFASSFRFQTRGRLRHARGHPGERRSGKVSNTPHNGPETFRSKPSSPTIGPLPLPSTSGSLFCSSLKSRDKRAPHNEPCIYIYIYINISLRYRTPSQMQSGGMRTSRWKSRRTAVRRSWRRTRGRRCATSRPPPTRCPRRLRR